MNLESFVRSTEALNMYDYQLRRKATDTEIQIMVCSITVSLFLLTNEDSKVYHEYAGVISATSVCNGVQIRCSSFKCLQGF